MVDILSLLFEIVAVVCCLHYLYGEKLRFDVMTIGFIVLEMSCLLCVNRFTTDNRWSLIMYPMVMLYCGLKFGFNMKAIVVNNILYMAIISRIQATMAIVLGIFMNVMNVKIQLALLSNIFTLILIILVSKKFKFAQLSKILQCKESLTVIALIAMVAVTVLFLFSYKRSSGFDTLYYIVLLMCIMLIGIAAWDIGKHKMQVREKEAELRLHRLYEESFRNMIDDICARQHEYDNHINVICHQYLLYDNYDDLVRAQRKYCETIVWENKYNKLLSKGHPVILGFLYGKFVEAEKKGVDVTYKVTVGDMECSVPIHKIVELLGNLLKNAVEELLENNLRRMYVLVIEYKDLIQIEVSNEVHQINYKEIAQFFKKGYSQKGDRRGYGLYNVKKICTEYDIDLRCGDKSDEDETWLSFNLTIRKSL